MKEVKVKINIATGLHARPAALVVSQTSKFKCNIIAQKGDKKANLKSLIDILSLGICQYDEILIQTDGVDETKAIEKISKLLTSFDFP